MTDVSSGRLAVRLRVYVVTTAPPRQPGRHVDIAAAAVAGGATAVQVRAPELDDEALADVVARVLPHAREAGALLLVNDRADVALDTGADGVHVGQDDDFTAARARLRPGQLLGVSVRGPEDVAAAVDAGADYLGVTVWPTTTKADAVPAGLEGLRLVAAVSPVPVVGIGGITAANAREVLAAGAAGIAVISAVADAPDPVAATRQLVAATETPRKHAAARTGGTP